MTAQKREQLGSVHTRILATIGQSGNQAPRPQVAAPTKADVPKARLKANTRLMGGHRLSAETLDTEEQLRALLGAPAELVVSKVVDRLNPLTRRFIDSSNGKRCPATASSIEAKCRVRRGTLRQRARGPLCAARRLLLRAALRLTSRIRASVR
jgi:hypothetical protein